METTVEVIFAASANANALLDLEPSSTGFFFLRVLKKKIAKRNWMRRGGMKESEGK